MGFTFVERLGTRVTAMLSVALLPVGIIAVFQTRSVISQAEELARSAMISETRGALVYQNDILQQGFAAARVLAGAVGPLSPETSNCSELMGGFIQAHPDFILAAYIDEDGQTVCNSDGRAADLSDRVTYRSMLAEQTPKLMRVKGELSGRDILLLMQPVIVEDEFLGLVSLSLPSEKASFQKLDLSPVPEEMLLINAEGEVLLSEDGTPQADDLLPAYRDLSTFQYRSASTFTTADRTGETRFYALVPIVPGVVSGVAVWDDDVVYGDQSLLNRAALAFPVLMWAISLIVAFFAVHRLVIRHVRVLRDKMRLFGVQGVVPDFSNDEVENSRTPVEIRQMEETFNRMVERITQDTAELENNLHEKNVLLKEVHHRVKNNLQLIASIMNMEIRKTSQIETKQTLRRVQDRILGLATVHSNLYHTSRLASLRADSLLDEILQHSLNGALPDGTADVTIDIDDAILTPDQAVPLSLLATEAATNAVKYLGRPADGSQPWVRATLKPVDDECVMFCISNSQGDPIRPDSESPTSNGLGTQLINAFASQLGSRADVTSTEDEYTLCVSFEVRRHEDDDEPEPL